MTIETRNAELEEMLVLLGLERTKTNWDLLLKKAKEEKPSYYRFLSDALIEEGIYRKDSPTSNEDYVFYSVGGASWTVPYIAGLFALACQVKATIK